jgi:predicted ATPase/class 3 adenylate cyclase
VRRDLPSGTVTFLFTDVEGSTKLLHELGAEDYAQALAQHRRVLRDAFAAHGGVEVDTQGDAFFVAFPTAPGALRAAAEALEGLAAGPIRVRMGIHTGTPYVAEEGYFGADVHRAARIAACGHGGQVLVSSAAAALVGTEGLQDLGEHRLKDLSAPERIYQLGDAEFPPLESLYRTNLPIPSTPFLGRDEELGQVVELLAQNNVRLLTLTGPGGTGKTRLALQAAGELATRYPQGVWWVPLATLRDAELVLAAAGQAVGAQDGVAEHVADRALLLLFDNFEHLVGAAADLAALLASCPKLDMLVTSREPLHVAGEQEYAVPPLLHEEGIELFVARARAVDAGFQADDAVSEVCRRLDDLPLALELAAARVKALSPTQILERLERRLPLLTGGARDVPERQRTLRATIEWSHELLTPEEQRLFARLAVFRGGCTLEAAEEVAEADLDTLQSLVDKSLLRRTQERFWMLETIREFALEQLEGAGEAEELGLLHAEYLLTLAEEAEPSLRAESTEWLDRLEREQDNLRAALDRLEASGEREHALRLAAAAWRLWSLRGPLEEGRRRVEAALRGDERPTAARAKALRGAADLALDTGYPATTRLRAEEALALDGALGDEWGVAESLLLLGLALAFDGDFSSAQERFDESARLFRRLGDDHYTLHATRRLAWTYEELGDLESARALHEDNLRLARETRDERFEAESLGVLAQHALGRGRVDEAVSMLKEAHHIHRGRRGISDRYWEAVLVCRFACALAMEGDGASAARLLSCSEALLDEIGVGTEAWFTKMNDETLDAVRAQLDDADIAEAWEQGRALTADEAVALALESLH